MKPVKRAKQAIIVRKLKNMRITSFAVKPKIMAITPMQPKI
jgi:hypothetical protein